MYSGRLIDDLIEAVARAEEHSLVAAPEASFPQWAEPLPVSVFYELPRAHAVAGAA